MKSSEVSLRPLEGVRVLDFTQLLPGGHAGMVLADFGAQVIKIEPPGGDPMRKVLPQLASGDSARHRVLNRGKRSVVADLKDSDQLMMIKGLVADCDVVLESFRPGVMDRLGLGYAELSALNPRLVYLSLTGYGDGGARGKLASHDLNFLALTGLLDSTASGYPPVPPMQIGDLAGGSLQAVIGVLMALRVAERTGKGQRVEVSMLDGLVSLLASAIADASVDPGTTPGRGRLAGDFACYTTYPCRDGMIAVGALEEKFWRQLTIRLGLEDLAAIDHLDPDAEVQRFLRERVAAALADLTEQDARDLGEDLCVSPVRKFARLLDDPELRARGVLRPDADADGPLHVGVQPRLLDHVAESVPRSEPLGASTGQVALKGWNAWADATGSGAQNAKSGGQCSSEERV